MEARVRRVTIYSVARACGVSSSTVSRAFTRPDLVKDSVRQRILETAAAMGYQPNKSARAIATGRTAMVGLVVPDITNPFMPPLFRAVQRAAGASDCSILLVDAEESTSAEAQLLSQLRGQVDGLVLAAPRVEQEVLLEAAAELPCVLINRAVSGLSSVVCDNGAALAGLGDQLVELGHRTVALLGGPAASWAGRQRTAAVRGWASDAGVTLIELGPFDASYDGGRLAGAALVETEATVAFAFDDVMACGVLAELAARGVDVPGDRSVVGCDDVLLARMVTPSLTTVTAPVDALGQVAIGLLLDLINDDDAPPRAVTVDGVMAWRDSTPERKGTA